MRLLLKFLKKKSSLFLLLLLHNCIPICPKVEAFYQVHRYFNKGNKLFLILKINVFLYSASLSDFHDYLHFKT
jgi:hypothetical protein